eukprot:TRINITY_DN2197_c1_g1_i1.p1 TRINITY_DN2197_c1_g1~~TRINITY_DN2197_c1_g1_i1.p1  ORF type:complete len:657 (+),score=258.70 TRINITY_DN2197_c1_g1_i1:97-2067(+)
MTMAAARGSVLVMTMLEEDQRMDIKWSEQVARTMTKNTYLKGLQQKDGRPLHSDPTADPPETPDLGNFAELLRSVTLPTPSKARSVSGTPGSPTGAAAQVAVLEQALDLAGKENGKLRQQIRNLEWELNVKAPGSEAASPPGPAVEEAGLELKGFDDIPLAESTRIDIPKPVSVRKSPCLDTSPTPAERAWKRALDLSVLPRTISEESFQEETYDWRRTLELREAAVQRRERLLETREADMREVEKMKSDYNQQTKELAIKEKEFKLRFRGIEELEARGKDIARRLEGIDAREKALAEREQALHALQDQLALKERQLAAAGVDCAAAAASDPPPKLRLTVPALGELSGEYVLSDTLHAGHPMWVCDEERAVYHDRASGKWYVGFEESREESLAWMASLHPHGGKFPDLVMSWGLAEDEGGACTHADDIEVTAAAAADNAPPPPSIKVLVPTIGDLCGVYDLVGDVHEGHPVWCCDGDRTLYSHKGKWHLGFEEAREEGRAWLQSMGAHNGALPHAIDAWGVAEDEGGDVMYDAEVAFIAGDAAAAAAPPPADDPSPPAVLSVEVPCVGSLSGEYKLSEAEHCGRPFWTCESAGTALYHEAGRWVVGFEEEMDEGVVWMASSQPHRGAMPHTVTQWEAIECEGEDFKQQDDVTVAAA